MCRKTECLISSSLQYLLVIINLKISFIFFLKINIIFNFIAAISRRPDPIPILVDNSLGPIPILVDNIPDPIPILVDNSPGSIPSIQF